MMNKHIRVGGVPEHFNLAWLLAIEQGIFEEMGITIEWQDVPGGTGAMCKMLADGELDMAIALTEGVVSSIVAGSDLRIIQFYVNSPLRWGIYTGSEQPINDLTQLQGKKYAISRLNSGSHLMALANARNLGVHIDTKDFVLVGNLEGARKALKTADANIFMWEKFMTKPLVDGGEFKLLGECSTPWPCFVVVANKHYCETQLELIEEVMKIVNSSCYQLKFMEKEASKMIAWRYGLKAEDAAQWFSELEYAYTQEMDELQLIGILNDLKGLGIISRIPALEEVCLPQHLIKENEPR